MAQTGSINIPITLGGLPIKESAIVPRGMYLLINGDDKPVIGRLVQDYDGMTLNEYQRQSMRTADEVPDYPDPGWLFQTSGFGLGIAGEAGEVADYLKKVIHHQHPLDPEVVKKELGDVLWYVQGIAERCGLTLDEVARANIDKLKARYPEGWSAERSINRDPE